MAIEFANETGSRSRTLRQLGAYFGLTFAITWGLGALLILARPQLEAIIGPIGETSHHWLYYVAVYAPTISAVSLSLAFGGWAGVKALAMRFVRPARPAWLLIALLFWPLVLTLYELAMRVAGAAGGVDLHALWVGAPVLALTTTALITDPGGFGEEIGWRGFALPRLLTLCRPLTAALILGFIWGLWHLPAFFVSDLSQSQFALGWFLLTTTTLTVVMTWIFVNANGNLLVAGVIPHLMLNLLFDVHALSGNIVRIEAISMTVLAVGLVAILGPSLKGWRSPESASEEALSSTVSSAGS
ncbi:type II CAAX prenyl endopeptidase Rce1 family protein [Phenylobacterium sp.]|uniref:CPBP family glutamic-type intramembrane protease n=1 Tax=Phenylobacterium sp. TaxID=1871053 RepID=UPI0035678941